MNVKITPSKKNKYSLSLVCRKCLLIKCHNTSKSLYYKIIHFIDPDNGKCIIYELLTVQ